MKVVWAQMYDYRNIMQSGRSKNLEQRLEKTPLLEFVLFNYLITYIREYVKRNIH